MRRKSSSRMRHVSVTDAREALGGTDDVEEEHGREHAVDAHRFAATR